MPKATNGNVTLFYEDEGSGKPVLLIHGHTMDRRIWDPVMPGLRTADLRILRPDLRGHGRSTRPDFGYHVSHHASDMAAVLDDAGIDGREVLLDATVEGEKVSGKISAAAGKMGENILLNRCQRLAMEGSGRVGGYVHAGGKLGVVIGLATEASGEALDVLGKDLAMHVAAADPSPVAVDRDGVSQELIEREKDLFRRQAEQEGKPDKVIEKIVEGRIKKYYSEVCLLEQGFVKDPDKTVKQLLEEVAAQLTGPVSITSFVRFKLGEAASE